MRQTMLAIGGALAGGLLGYFVFFWIAEQGYYGIMLPGGLLGLGAGIFKNRSRTFAVVCGLLAIALGLFTEWQFAPFRNDNSLAYFLLHVQELKPVTLLMIGVGGLIAFWVPLRRFDPSAPRLSAGGK